MSELGFDDLTTHRPYGEPDLSLNKISSERLEKHGIEPATPD